MLRSAAFVGQQLHHSVVAIVGSVMKMIPEVGGNKGRVDPRFDWTQRVLDRGRPCARSTSCQTLFQRRAIPVSS
jgi:hypothetical protein